MQPVTAGTGDLTAATPATAAQAMGAATPAAACACARPATWARGASSVSPGPAHSRAPWVCMRGWGLQPCPPTPRHAGGLLTCTHPAPAPSLGPGLTLPLPGPTLGPRSSRQGEGGLPYPMGTWHLQKGGGWLPGTEGHALQCALCGWVGGYGLGLEQDLLQAFPEVTPGQRRGQRHVGEPSTLGAGSQSPPLGLRPPWDGRGPGQDWARLSPQLMVGRGHVSQGVPRAALGRAVGGGASVSTGQSVTTSAGPAPVRLAGEALSASSVSQGVAGRGGQECGGGPGDPGRLPITDPHLQPARPASLDWTAIVPVTVLRGPPVTL